MESYLSVCLGLCLFARVGLSKSPNVTKISVHVNMWPWFGHRWTTMQYCYVAYLQFRGWRRVFTGANTQAIGDILSIHCDSPAGEVCHRRLLCWSISRVIYVPIYGNATDFVRRFITVKTSHGGRCTNNRWTVDCKTYRTWKLAENRFLFTRKLLQSLSHCLWRDLTATSIIETSFDVWRDLTCKIKAGESSDRNIYKLNRCYSRMMLLTDSLCRFTLKLLWFLRTALRAAQSAGI